jgi:hypothetical protein
MGAVCCADILRSNCKLAIAVARAPSELTRNNVANCSTAGGPDFRDSGSLSNSYISLNYPCSSPDRCYSVGGGTSGAQIGCGPVKVFD